MEVIVFDVAYPHVAAAQAAHGIKSSGNYRRLHSEVDRGVELQILISAHSAAITQNNKRNAKARREEAARNRLKRELAKEVIGEYTRLHTCPTCTKLSPTRLCSDDCRKELNRQQRRKYRSMNKDAHDAYKGKGRERCYKRGLTYTYGISAKRLAARDGYICQVCGEKVEPHLGKGWQPRGWSIGHIKALEHGGSTTWDNVQLEHIGCNVAKGMVQREQYRQYAEFVGWLRNVWRGAVG